MLAVLPQVVEQSQTLVGIHITLSHQPEAQHLQQVRSNKCIKKTEFLTQIWS
jgi:hypothetical protein